MSLPKATATLISAVLAISALLATAADNSDSALHQLMDRQAEQIIASDPELRTALGISDDGRDDLDGQLTDASPQRRAFLHREMLQMRSEIEAVDPAGLSSQERWSHAMAVWLFTAQSDLLAFEWASPRLSPYAVDQLFSDPVVLPQFMANQHPLHSEANARHYLSRLQAIPAKLDQLQQQLDLQARHGVIPPRVALDGVALQIRELLRPTPTDSPFTEAFRQRLQKVSDIDSERRQALTSAVEAAVAEQVNPAYTRLLRRVEQAREAMPHSRGVWSLPDGDRYYEAALRWNTSTSLSPEEIHSIGLEEVARIEQEMEAILQAQELTKGTLTDRLASLATQDRFRYEDSAAGREQLLGDIHQIIGELQPLIPKYFSRTPSQPMEVRPVPAHAESTAPGGYYYPPALDGSRGGIFFINLGDMDANTRIGLSTLAYHEGTPGHHFQIALSQTLDQLPFLRRNLNPSAFSEGWALYAEQLVAEMGVYRDNPWGDLGRLQAEMFRAVRLVVDTGLHWQRWTPEKAVAYMIEKTGKPAAEAHIEINRYLVQPGQAASYKIGHLRILALRERAKKALGEDFDIRHFHDLVLGNGALPLDVLEATVDEWIAAG